MKLIITCSFLTCILLGLSCSSGYIGAGFSSDRGVVLERNGTEVDRSGQGGFLEYRWQKMKGLNGYGLDFNLHLNAYAEPDTDGNIFGYQSLQAKYYRVIAGADNLTPVKMEFATGLGLGAIDKHVGDPILVANGSLNFYFPKNRLFFISTKMNYIRKIGGNRRWKGGTSLEVGVGMRIFK